MDLVPIHGITCNNIKLLSRLSFACVYFLLTMLGSAGYTQCLPGVSHCMGYVVTFLVKKRGVEHLTCD